MSANTNQMQDATLAAPEVAPPIAPVPMSFPAMLLNPRTKTPHASRPSRDLDEHKPSKVSTSIDGKTRGKRHVRRFENVTFRNNPYIALPAHSDYQVPPTDVKTTFPIPLPPYLPRVSAAPSAAVIMRSDPSNLNSAYAGRFTLSLRGLRKDLRQRGGARARMLVQDIESAIQTWLGADATPVADAQPTMRAIDRSEPPAITEISYSPMEMVWTTEDPFSRWIIHCVSRWHNVVSFSKDVPVASEGGSPKTQRQTHLLRPNSRHPDPRSTAALYTPTATDLESSAIDTEDSDYSHLADSISSLQIIDTTSGSRVQSTEVRIEEEPESSHSDAESSFSVVEHPDEANPTVRARDVDDHVPPADEATRSQRLFSRMDGARFQPNISQALRSDSSPSRSPIRARRLRQTRRVVGQTRRAQTAFRSSEPPTTFMAYVYGTSG